MKSCDRASRRQFIKHFNFPQFNQYFLKHTLNPEQTIIAVISKFWDTVRELHLDFIGKLRIVLRGSNYGRNKLAIVQYRGH